MDKVRSDREGSTLQAACSNDLGRGASVTLFNKVTTAYSSKSNSKAHQPHFERQCAVHACSRFSFSIPLACSAGHSSTAAHPSDQETGTTPAIPRLLVTEKTPSVQHLRTYGTCCSSEKVGELQGWRVADVERPGRDAQAKQGYKI